MSLRTWYRGTFLAIFLTIPAFMHALFAQDFPEWYDSYKNLLQDHRPTFTCEIPTGAAFDPEISVQYCQLMAEEYGIKIGEFVEVVTSTDPTTAERYFYRFVIEKQ